MDISKKDFKIIFNITKNYDSNEFKSLIENINNNSVENQELNNVLNSNDKNQVIEMINNSESEDLMFIQQGASTKSKKDTATSSAVPETVSIDSETSKKVDTATSSAVPETPSINSETSNKSIKIKPVTKKANLPIGEEAKVSVEKFKNFIKTTSKREKELAQKEKELAKKEAELKDSEEMLRTSESDFSKIIDNLLSSEEPVIKSKPVVKPEPVATKKKYNVNSESDFLDFLNSEEPKNTIVSNNNDIDSILNLL